jgi:SEC-C motif
MPDTYNRYGLSRTIPEDVKRQVRQTCGFECVCCGLAIVTYEHIDPEFHNAESHDPDKMALLCGNCHGRVTRGFWSKEKIKEARRDPFCIRQGKCHDAFDIGQQDLTVWIGTVKVVNIETILRVDETILLSIEPPEQAGSPYRLSGEFYDDSGNPLFRISRNEWFGETSNWDIECIGGKVIIRSQFSLLTLQILCNPPNGIIIEKMNMSFRGTRFISDGYELRVKGHDKGIVIISGREIVAHSEGCVALSATSRDGHSAQYQGGALKIGNDGALMLGGGGTFSVAALPKPSSFPNPSKAEYQDRHWGQIRIFVPPSKSNKLGKNDPCPCESGLKYKKCCGN